MEALQHWREQSWEEGRADAHDVIMTVQAPDTWTGEWGGRPPPGALTPGDPREDF